MTLDECRVIANTITDSIRPLMKWIAVKHALDRCDTVDELSMQFPWLDLYDDSTDVSDDDDESDDTEDEEDIDDEENDDDIEERQLDESREQGEIPLLELSRVPGVTMHPEIPQEIADTIYNTWGMTPDVVDTVMQLISLAENGSSQWPLFYNYIEYGDDHAVRGYTTTIFGATSGTGSLLEVFKELQAIDPDHPLVVTYMDALEHATGGDISGLEGLAHVGGDPTKATAKWSNWTKNGRTHLDHIEGDLARLEVDDRWRRAVWRAFLRLNWVSAAHFCNKTGPCEDRPGPLLTSRLAKGFVVDTSLNHGDCRWWNDAETWTVIWDEMSHHPTDEKKWLRAFMKARRTVLRSGFQGLDWSKTGDRVTIWLDQLRDGNMDLDRPIYVTNSTQSPPIWPDDIVIM
jgi:hypothetical protein